MEPPEKSGLPAPGLPPGMRNRIRIFKRKSINRFLAWAGTCCNCSWILDNKFYTRKNESILVSDLILIDIDKKCILVIPCLVFVYHVFIVGLPMFGQNFPSHFFRWFLYVNTYCSEEGKIGFFFFSSGLNAVLIEHLTSICLVVIFVENVWFELQ